ncbi:transglutaminase-like putative cysteine protease [Saonia flava]|uniref:Transglutaminase-like putative cysteine protease n=1 Tax=Saonia flava TaxID=523696 RepID=A0A846R0D1_9FLAO|nr:DUF3857 domain-containing protein [Saonia flava]NJB70824.1 transglutaminase-like putative cysteine protease [Saonia flava]
MRLFSYIILSLFYNLSVSQTINYSSESIPKELLVNANAVVRINDMHIEIVALRQMKITHTRVVTVINESGSKHAQAYIGYNKSLKVKNAQAIIYDSYGKVLDKKKQKDFIDVSAVDGGTLYSDSRVLFLGYTPIQYPYTISFTYEVITDNTGTIPSWVFLDGFMVSTENSSYKLDFSSPELKPNIKERNFEGYAIEREEVNGGILYRANNIAAIKEESLSPSFNKLVPRLMISPFNFYYEGYEGTIKEWNDVGLWMYSNLLKGRDELELGTVAKIKELVNDEMNDLEKAKLVYKYVQQNTRYISVQVGIGGLQPISAIEVDKLKYGDCKGLSNYTKALLKAVGVKAYYTHVEAGRDKIDFENNFPSIGQGNHVILAIPYNEKYYWIDCTSQVHPFGFLGDFTDGRRVLLIKPDGGEIVTTESYINDDNHQKTYASVRLKESGSIVGDIKVLTKGTQYDNHFYLEDMADLELEKYYKNYWKNINNLEIESYQFENNKDSVVFGEHIKVNATKYATVTDGKLLLSGNLFNNSQYVPNRYRSRKLPFEVQRGYLDEDEYIIDLPEGYAVEAFPQETSIKNMFGEYEVSYALNGNQIIFKRRLLIKKGDYVNTDYNDYRNFRREISKNDNSKIVLTKI